LEAELAEAQPSGAVLYSRSPLFVTTSREGKGKEQRLQEAVSIEFDAIGMTVVWTYLQQRGVVVKTITFEYQLADGRIVSVEATLTPPDRSVGIDWETVDDLKITDSDGGTVEVAEEEDDRICDKACLLSAQAQREPIPGDYD
jgi:hypothetical protein